MLSLVVVGCADESVPQLLTSARQYLAVDDPSAALVQIKRALQVQPSSAEARLLLGRGFLGLGDNGSALVELQRASDLKASEDEVVPDLAQAMMLLGQHRAVVDRFGRIALSDKRRASSLAIAVAAAHLGLGEHDQALAQTRRALQFDPTHAPALLMQARLQLATNRESSLQTVQLVLDKEPKNIAAWKFRGDILCSAAVVTEACFDAYRQALAIRPGYLPAHAGLVASQLAKPDVVAARQALESMRKVLPQQPETRFFEARVELVEGNREKAREIAQELLRSFPDQTQLLEFAAAVELASNSTFQAVAMLNKALLLNPQLVGARRLLALAYLRNGESKRVLETLEPLVQVADVDALLLSAQAHVQTGSFAQAEPLFKAALKARPQDAKGRTAYAVALLSRGNDEQAMAELRNVAETDTGSLADKSLISTLLRSQRFDDALAAIDHLQKKDPKNPEAADLRGRVFLARQDNIGARKSFEQAVAVAPEYFPSLLALVSLDLLEKQPARARSRFESMLERDPRNTRVTLALADVYERSGAKPEMVTKLLTEAVRLNPTDPALRVVLVEHYLRARDPGAAKAAMEEASAAFPRDLGVLGVLGRMQLSRGDYEQAASTYNTAAAASPQSVDALLRLSETHFKMKKLDAAQQDLLRALERQPMSIAAQRGLIALALLERKPAVALSYARTLQSQYPDKPFGHLLEGDVHTAAGNSGAALIAYRAALQRQPDTEIAAKVFLTLRSISKAQEAAAFAAEWLAKHPADSAFMFNLGTIALAANDYAGAEKHFAMVLRIQPGHGLALNNMAWLKLKTGQPGALPLAERAQKSMPDSPEVLDTYSAALLGAGQVQQALAVQRRAVDLAPANPQLRLQLARAALGAGDRALAQRELKSLSDLGAAFAGSDEVMRLLKSI